LPFGWRLDDHHLRQNHVFPYTEALLTDADFGEVSAKDDSLLKDGVIANLDVV
jgi:hypothetical protein